LLRKQQTNFTVLLFCPTLYISFWFWRPVQIKSNQIIYLDKQIQKNVDKMTNEKA